MNEWNWIYFFFYLPYTIFLLHTTHLLPRLQLRLGQVGSYSNPQDSNRRANATIFSDVKPWPQDVYLGPRNSCKKKKREKLIAMQKDDCFFKKRIIKVGNKKIFFWNAWMRRNIHNFSNASRRKSLNILVMLRISSS